MKQCFFMKTLMRAINQMETLDKIDKIIDMLRYSKNNNTARNGSLFLRAVSPGLFFDWCITAFAAACGAIGAALLDVVPVGASLHALCDAAVVYIGVCSLCHHHRHRRRHEKEHNHDRRCFRAGHLSLIFFLSC